MAGRIDAAAQPGNGRGRRRRGVSGTAAAVAAMAALTASQAPGVAAQGAPSAERVILPSDDTITGNAPYITALPPLEASHPSGESPDQRSPGLVGRAGRTLPTTVLDAYRRAEDTLARSNPGCHLRWQLLAAIGQVESGQARGGRVNPAGTTHAPILGPRLDGNGFASISDTDGGTYDGDSRYDRAVGPMQFIPSTWATWGADGNADGVADPNNIYDAALAAGRYLCAGGRDLSNPQELDQAILGYNHSLDYLRTVKAWFTYFLDGHIEVPDLPAGGAARPAPRPEASRPAPRPKPSPTAQPSRTSAPPSPRPTRSSASPSPAPSRGGDGRDGSEPVEPKVTLPGVDPTLPDVDGDTPSLTVR